MSDIPNLKNREWGEKKELGSATHVVEYIDGGEVKKVEVEAHTSSTATMMAIEAEHTSIDKKTKEERLDGDGYIMGLMCAVFDIEMEYLKTIFANKGSTLRDELIALMNRTCGFAKDDQQAQKEKNLDSPQS